MKVASPLRLLLMIASSSVLAEDLTTLDGKVYRNYEITGRTSSGLSMRHEGGAATILFKNLPEELRDWQPEPAADGKLAEKKDGAPAVPPPHDPVKDLVTSDGQVYRNYVITGRAASGLTIRHEGGAATVLFKNLPEELRDWQPDPDPDRGLAEKKDGTPVVPPPHDPVKDLVTSDGQVYRNYSIRKVEPDGLSILHDAGVTKVEFERLSEEIQKRYNYDPFDAYDHDQAEAQRQRAAEMKRDAASKIVHDEAAKALAEKKFLDAFGRSASQVQIGPGLESFWVCNGMWGKTPAALQAAGVQDYVGGLACNVTLGTIGMVPAYSGALRRGERKAWVYRGVSEPSFVHFSKKEVDYLTGQRLLEFSQTDGKITKLSHELKVWRIGKVKMTSVIGVVAEFPNYTTSGALAAKFYREHGFPEKSSKVVLEWAAVYQ